MYLPAMWEIWVQSLGREDTLEKEMATHSSILAWRIPRMEELGGLHSIGHKGSDTTERLHFHFTFTLSILMYENLSRDLTHQISNFQYIIQENVGHDFPT